MITFPTEPKGRCPPGRPERAQHCQCDRPLMDTANQRCMKCGRHGEQVVRDTWLLRAQQIARKRAKRAA